MTSDQQDLVREVNNAGPGPALVSNERNEVHATDTLNWDTNGNFLGPSGAKTTQTYRLQTSRGNCWDRTITAEVTKADVGRRRTGVQRLALDGSMQFTPKRNGLPSDSGWQAAAQ